MKIGLSINSEIMIGRDTSPGQEGVISKIFSDLSDTIFCTTLEIRFIGNEYKFWTQANEKALD